jgi:hypothetical protein
MWSRQECALVCLKTHNRRARAVQYTEEIVRNITCAATMDTRRDAEANGVRTLLMGHRSSECEEFGVKLAASSAPQQYCEASAITTWFPERMPAEPAYVRQGKEKPRVSRLSDYRPIIVALVPGQGEIQGSGVSAGEIWGLLLSGRKPICRHDLAMVLYERV